MDDPQFDHLTRCLSAVRTRRRIVEAATALPLAGGVGLLLTSTSDARRKQPRSRVQPEKKRKPSYCLNGETIQTASKRKKKKLIKQGATRGACPETCGTPCAPGLRCCGNTCAAGPWELETQFGAFGTGPSQFDYPNSVAISADGLTAWIADAQNDRISVWTRPTASSTAWANADIIGSTGTGMANFQGPECVRVAPDERTMWVVDTLNNRVSEWTRPSKSAAWAPFTIIGNSDYFDFPGRMAVSADGLTIWVCEGSRDRIAVWSRTSTSSAGWTFRTTFGASGSGLGKLDQPRGVAVAPDGLTAWVSDSDNNRVSVWTRPDTDSDVWSNPTTFGTLGNGPANLNYPLGLVVSPDGLKVWVVDGQNQRVSIWTRANATSIAWAPQTTISSPALYSGDIALTPDQLTALTTHGDSGNNISVWTIPCPG